MINVIFGLALFFLPGFLITEIYFKKSEAIEKLLYVALFSTSFLIIIGIILGFNEFTFKITGGFNNLHSAYLISNAALIIFYFIKKKSKNKVTSARKQKK